MKWTSAQLARLRSAYVEAQTSADIGLTELAEEFGRDKANVCRKARELGLTDQRRRKVLERKKNAPKYASEEERRRVISEKTRAWIARNGHPRGALGMKHSPETLAKLSEASRRNWADPTSSLNSAEFRERQRLRALELRAAGKFNRGGFVACAGGRRADLGDTYFRSSWEANYARYLNWLVARGHVASWEYEPKTFIFERISRGTRSYTPDFRVVHHDGSHEWHEVKGWMNQRSRTRLARMARYYPEERIVVIDSAWFRRATRSGLAGMIPGWERKPQRREP